MQFLTNLSDFSDDKYIFIYLLNNHTWNPVAGALCYRSLLAAHLWRDALGAYLFHLENLLKGWIIEEW